MAHLHRFHISPDLNADGPITLSPEESHHALHVVRLRVGERILLFDGRGREIDGSVARLTHREVTIEPESERQVPPPAVRLTVLQAWLLREKSIEYLIQHGTELGVSCFCFFRARHSEKAPKINPKWQRYAIEACKQCGRAWLPSFDTASDLNDAIASVQGPVLIATQAMAPVSISDALRANNPKNVALLVGPEGDFAPEEVERAIARGAIPISLGVATYRSEVATTIAASLILYECGALGPKTDSPPEDTK